MPSAAPILISACIAVALAAADLTAVSTLLPQIIIDLDVPLPEGLNDAAWVVSAYLIGNIVTLPISGRLADRLDRRPVFSVCLALFVLGSISSALAPTLGWLIAARALQALGAGALLPVTMALATDLLPPSRWAIAFGIIGAVDTAGWAVGPLYGAYFVRYLDWRWLFWINVPLALLVGGVTWCLLAPLRVPRSTRPIGLPSVLVFTAGLIALNWGLSRLGVSATAGVDLGRATLAVGAALPWLLGGVGLLGGVVLIERRSSAPLLQRGWLGQRTVVTASISNVIFGMMLVVATVNVPLFVNAVAGRQSDSIERAVRDAALESGLVLAAMTLVMTLCAPLGGWLATRLSFRSITTVGALACGAGFLLMRGWIPQTTLPTMFGHLALVGVGFGLLIAPIATALIQAAPAHERGLASSLVLLLRLSGMSLGLSALTAWSLTRFRVLAAPYSIGELPQVIDQLTAQVLAGSFGLAAVLAFIVLLVNLLGGNSNHV
jgi:MFS family permease